MIKAQLTHCMNTLITHQIHSTCEKMAFLLTNKAVITGVVLIRHLISDDYSMNQGIV